MKIRDLGFDLDAKRLMSKIARFCKIKERSLSSLHRLIGSIQLSFEIQAKNPRIFWKAIMLFYVSRG